jgi:histidine triad (HIT) family protein
MASIFTKIIDREIPGHIVAEDDQFIAILDIMPLVEGHVLVIPKKEVDYLFDLDEESYQGLMTFARKIAGGLKKAIPCKRVGVAVIGLEVPHVHVHLIPMQQMDDMNFSRPKLKPSQDELASTAEKIKQLL